MPYAVKIDASLSGIKCYLCSRLQNMHIDCAFFFSSPFISLLFSVYLLYIILLICLFLSNISSISPGKKIKMKMKIIMMKKKESVKSTFQKFLLLFVSNGNIPFKE